MWHTFCFGVGASPVSLARHDALGEKQQEKRTPEIVSCGCFLAPKGEERTMLVAAARDRRAHIIFADVASR